VVAALALRLRQLLPRAEVEAFAQPVVRRQRRAQALQKGIAEQTRHRHVQAWLVLQQVVAGHQTLGPLAQE
jgi:predicted transcriptional regulator